MDNIIGIDEVVTVIRLKFFVKIKLITYNKTIKPLIKAFINSVMIRKIRIFL